MRPPKRARRDLRLLDIPVFAKRTCLASINALLGISFCSLARRNEKGTRTRKPLGRAYIAQFCFATASRQVVVIKLASANIPNVVPTAGSESRAEPFESFPLLFLVLYLGRVARREFSLPGCCCCCCRLAGGVASFTRCA